MKIPILALLLLLIAFPVFAHDPAIEEEDWGGFDEPYRVEDATISYALYGYLDEADIDVFQLDFSADDNQLRVEVLVPVCGEHYAEFQPHYAVFSDNPAAADPDLTEAEFPFAVPEGYAPVYVDADAAPEGERETFVEAFGGTEFYEAPRLDLDVPAGTYLIAVYAPDEETSGDYTIATGYREVFSMGLDTVTAVAAIRANSWLHRDCDLAPDDPNAIIEHEHEHEHED